MRTETCRRTMIAFAVTGLVLCMGHPQALAAGKDEKVDKDIGGREEMAFKQWRGERTPPERYNALDPSVDSGFDIPGSPGEDGFPGEGSPGGDFPGDGGPGDDFPGDGEPGDDFPGDDFPGGAPE